MKDYKKIKTDSDIIQDAINITNGAYQPLSGFLNKADFLNVLDNMRLADGSVWSIPIVLDIDQETYELIKNEDIVEIYNEENNSRAFIKPEEVYSFDKGEYAEKVFGTLDQKHHGVNEIFKKKELLLGGKVLQAEDALNDFCEYKLTPAETKKFFQEKNWRTIVAFQTRNFPHRSHEYLQMEALKNADGLFVHPVIGKKKPGDIKDELIIESYKILIDKYYPTGKTSLGILPIRMHYAGPREAIMHALIRRNYGCTHMIIGRDHAGVGNYYSSYAAHDIFNLFSDKEIGIEILKYSNVHYCPECGGLVFEDQCSHSHADKLHLSGTKIREMLKKKEILPEELIRLEISKILLKHFNPFVE